MVRGFFCILFFLYLIASRPFIRGKRQASCRIASQISVICGNYSTILHNYATIRSGDAIIIGSYAIIQGCYTAIHDSSATTYGSNTATHDCKTTIRKHYIAMLGLATYLMWDTCLEQGE